MRHIYLFTGIPSGAPTNISASPGDKPTSQILKWDPPVAELRNGRITQYTVSGQYSFTCRKRKKKSYGYLFRRAANVMKATSVSQVLFHRRDQPLYVNEVNVTETEVVLENLDSDVAYVFSVKAHTTLGPGPW